MDKRKIDQEVYDRYVDASVALFMEYYCASMSEKMEKMQAADAAFPETLDARCKRTIRKECAARKRRQFLKSAVKGLRYAAIFAVVLITLSSVLFVSVEAIRVPIINYYITLHSDHLEISQPQDPPLESPELINWYDPLDGLLPSGFVLKKVRYYADIEAVALYKDNANNRSVFLTVSPLHAVINVDTENAQEIRDIRINGNNCIFVLKGSRISIVWIDEVEERVYIIITIGLSETEAAGIASQFMDRLEAAKSLPNT